MSNFQERLEATRIAMSAHLAAHVEYDAQTSETKTRTRLHMAAEAVGRASRSPTVFGVLDNLDAALYEIAEALDPLVAATRGDVKI